MEMNHVERAAFHDTCQMAALAAHGPGDFELSLVDRNQPAAANANDRATIGLPQAIASASTMPNPSA